MPDTKGEPGKAEAREALSDEVKKLRTEARQLKKALAEVTSTPSRRLRRGPPTPTRQNNNEPMNLPSAFSRV